MPFDTFEDIMHYAIEKEKEAIAFYEDLSKQEQFSGNKETFKDFANEERKHRDMLENFSKENIQTYQIKKIPDLKRSDYLVDLTYEPGMGYADILKIAMKREEKAKKFYTDFAGKTHDPKHERLFEILAQEESKHKLALETMLDDFMAEMGD